MITMTGDDKDGFAANLSEHDLTEEERQLEAQLEIERKKYDTLKAQIDTLEINMTEIDATLGAADSATLETLRQLLEERDEAKRAESSFKRNCRAQLDALDAQIEEMRRSCENGNHTSVSNGLVKNANNAAIERDELRKNLNGLVDELTKINRDVYRLEREVEGCASQVELNQYQRRFLELYDQMSCKHRETKRYYVMHNTLVDVRNFVQREIDLLNNIDDSRNLALRDEYTDSFVENLQSICRNMEQNLDKVLCGKRTLQEECDALTDQLQLLVDKQRLYMKTVAEFQAECQKNESLRAALDQN